MTAIAAPTDHASTTTRALSWGVAIGAAQAAVAMAFWWLDPSTVHALMITMIAAVYIGFAVADGRTEGHRRRERGRRRRSSSPRPWPSR